MIIEERLSANGKKIYYRFIWGRGSSDRMSAGIFTYAKPKSQIEKNHNKESLTILELKRSQLVLDRQSIGTGYIPAHRYKQKLPGFFLVSLLKIIYEPENGTSKIASTTSKHLSGKNG